MNLLWQTIPKRPWTGWRPVYGFSERFGTSAEAMIVRLDRLEWAHRDEIGESASSPLTVQANRTSEDLAVPDHGAGLVGWSDPDRT